MKQVYEIVDQTRYTIKTERVDLEDCSDVFLTWEEINSMNIESHWIGNSPRIDVISKNVKTDLNSLKKQLLKSNKKSIVMNDEMFEFFTSSKIPVTQYDGELKRTGNKLSILKVKEKSTPSFEDWKSMLDGLNRLLTKYGVYQYIKTDCDRVGMIELCKKLSTWTKFKDHLDEDDDVKFCKMIWDKPELCKTKTK